MDANATKKQIRLRLGLDRPVPGAPVAARYTHDLDVTVPTDATGLTVFDLAARKAYACLPSRLVRPPDDPDAAAEIMVYLELRCQATGDSYYAEDAELRGPEWLKDLVLAAEIVEP